MPSLKAIWNCFFSPRLIKVYGNANHNYEPHALEKWGDQVISSLYIMWKISVYTSPIIIPILYQRDYFSSTGLITLSKFVTSIGVILVVSYICKSIGRASDPTYNNFIKVLQEANENLTPVTKQKLNQYDFDFKAWPVEFKYYNSDKSRPTNGNVSTILSLFTDPQSDNIVQGLIRLPFRIAASLAIHSFGIRLIYPGSLGFLKLILDKALLQGRTRLIEYHRGERFKLKACDKNEIDCMFVDKRNTSNGNTLVICCEGNAGFYEIGIMGTPIEAGYSVLGWNHPGFGGSTGIPYPINEQNAIDTVIQFAIVKLGFKVENIVLYAWSIGGYTASWAAMNYPEVKALVLDATFDDILPLAINHMPRIIEPIVKIAIRQHVNLNVAEQVVKYPGPVLLIRRSFDEVIALREGDITSNRGNDLLKKILWYRYPLLFTEDQLQIVDEYLSFTTKKQEAMIKMFSVNEDVCTSQILTYINEYSKAFPMTIGEKFTPEEKN